LPFRQPPADRSVQRHYWRRGGVQLQSTYRERDVRIHKCCVSIIPRILTTDPRTGAFGTGGRNRAVQTNRLVCLSVCLSCLVLSVALACVPTSWTDQDETWHADIPRPWTHCLRWGPSFPSPNTYWPKFGGLCLKGHRPPNFGPHVLRQNGCMDRDATW